MTDAVLTDRASIATFATQAYQAGATHLAPIFRAAMAGRIAAMGLVRRQQQFPHAALKRFRLPTLLIIGDDDELATGPAGWRCAKQAAAWAAAWAAAAIVHGAGGEEAHYAIAVEGAVRFRRLIVVETGSAFVRPWGALMPGKPRLAILPCDGVHPVERRTGWVQ